MRTILACITFLLLSFSPASAQMGLTPDEEKKVEKAFQTANDLLENEKPREALTFYNEALAILPKDPSILYNAGMAAFTAEEYSQAADLWKRLKSIEGEDWRARAKLIQAYQALKRDADVNTERDELFALRKGGKVPELSEEDFYCREQFRFGNYRVVVFEHFELKGDRALKYVFMIDKLDKSEEFRISLGSYSMTNAVWRETTNPKPKEGERLFHLDGYFKWGHATYGMYPKEPTYADTRQFVVKILEGRNKPVSSTQIVK